MGEELQCGREVDNPHNSYAVSVLKRRQIVRHVPCSISRPCSVFLRSHGMIIFTIMGNRHCFLRSSARRDGDFLLTSFHW